MDNPWNEAEGQWAKNISEVQRRERESDIHTTRIPAEKKEENLWDYVWKDNCYKSSYYYSKTWILRIKKHDKIQTMCWSP